MSTGAAHAHLRSNAEERRRKISANPELPRTSEEMLRLVHELEVHQIELEVQNEQLLQTRDDLENALARYSDLYDYAPVGYFTIDGDSSIRSANLSGAGLIGIARSRLIGRQLRHLIADEDRPLFTEFINGIFANRGKESCEVSLTREGNTSIFVHIEAAFAPDGEECRITLSDITDRKHLEDALRKQEQFAHSIIDGLSENICVVDAQGMIVITNDSWKTFAKENSAFPEATGEGISYLDACRIINENDRADIEETISGIRAVIEGKLPIFAKEYPCHSPDVDRWFICKATPFSFFGANYAVISHENITARKQAEMAITELTREQNIILENAPVGIVKVIGRKQVWLNRKTVEMLLYSTGELEFQTTRKLYPSDTAFEKFGQEAYPVLAQGLTYESVQELVKRDGTHMLVRYIGNAIDPRNMSKGTIWLMEDVTTRNKIETELRMSEEKLRLLIEYAPVALVMLDNDMRYLQMSQRWRSNFGIGDRDIRGKSHYEVSPEVSDRWKEAHRRGLAGEILREESDRFDRADGSIQWVRWEIRPWLDANGDVGGIVIFSEDISERKLAEDALQLSRDFLSETEKIGKIGGWEFDIDTLELTWTEEVYRIHEVDMDFKPTIENGINFCAPLSRPIIEKAVQRAIAYGEPYDVELEVITAKGNLRSVHSIGKMDLAKRRVFGFFQDITEHKQAEEALKNSEERYHQLFEMESDTILMIDWENGRFLDANSAAARMYGYAREEFLQLSPADLSFEPTDTEKSIRNEEASVKIRWHRKKDGTVFPVEINGSCFVYQGRKVNVAAIRDITERVQAEQHLIDLNQRLRALSGHLQSVQEQERLAISRDMHDDVGQILTALKLDLGWLEQNIAPSENALPLRLKEMHKNVDQITAVVQRIAANLRPPLLDNQGLSAAIEWYVGEFGKRSGIECFIMINEDTDSVNKETATAVMRIIQEGLTNIARHAHATEVGISLCTRDGNLILEITDNGCGITQEKIDSQEAYGLMGMQERARLRDGVLEIKGEPGLGTILLLTIPLGLGEQYI